jgi:NAD-dependent dihydropyrimidine dehydrogenase PreA subunit
MIEFVLEDACIACGKCVEICPTDVFELTSGVVEIARKEDCTSCMNCELYCPTDALYVSPLRRPEVDLDRNEIVAAGLIGSYRRAMNWENGRAPSGTGDNWGVLLNERQGAKKPPPGDKIREQLYRMKDRNLI